MPTLAPPATEVLLRLQNVGKTFQMGEVAVEVLRHVTLDVLNAELLVMVGPSGSGKTTMLNIMGGLDTASVGRVLYRDRDLTARRARADALSSRDDRFRLSVLQSRAESHRSRERDGLDRDQPRPARR